jgi:hypothetical protein
MNTLTATTPRLTDWPVLVSCPHFTSAVIGGFGDRIWSDGSRLAAGGRKMGAGA